MSKHWKLLIALVALFSLIAAACGDDDEASDDGGTGPSASGALITLDEECEAWDGLKAPDGYTVNLVTDIGKVDDGTFNQFAFEGLQGAIECFGIDPANSSFIETVSEADYAANIATSL